VKTFTRFPWVKVTIDSGQRLEGPLLPGMSSVVTVETRDAGDTPLGGLAP
jgi:multidrug resistance efflux pump